LIALLYSDIPVTRARRSPAPRQRIYWTQLRCGICSDGCTSVICLIFRNRPSRSDQFNHTRAVLFPTWFELDCGDYTHPLNIATIKMKQLKTGDEKRVHHARTVFWMVCKNPIFQLVQFWTYI